MAKNSELLFTEGDKLVGEGAGVPIEYTVPYPWGTLRVSEAAHTMYGLRPVEDVVAGDSSALRDDAAPLRRTDVFVMTPEQLSGAGVRPISDGGFLGAGGGWVAEQHRGGLALGIAPDPVFARARSALEASLQAFVADRFSDPDAMASWEDVQLPMTRALEDRITHVQTHAFYMALGNASAAALLEAAEQRADRQLSRGNARGMAARLAAIAGMTAVFDLGTMPKTVALPMLAAYSGANLWLHSLSVRDRYEHRGRQESYIPRDAETGAAQITSSVHQTFCNRSSLHDFARGATDEIV